MRKRVMRTTADAGSSRLKAGGHLLQFDHIAFRIAHVDRTTEAARAVSNFRIADNLDSECAQIAGRLRKILRDDSEAKMIDIAGHVSGRLESRNQVDHAGAGAQLDQSERLDATLLVQAQH